MEAHLALVRHDELWCWYLLFDIALQYHLRPLTTAFLYAWKASLLDDPSRKTSILPCSTTMRSSQTLVSRCWSWLTS